MNEFAVVFVFDIDDTPLVCAGTDHFTIDIEGLFRADDGKWDSVLWKLEYTRGEFNHALICALRARSSSSNSSLSYGYILMLWKANSALIWKINIGPKRPIYPLLEGLTLGEGEGVRFGNDRDDIDDIRQFLEHNNVNRFQTI